MNVKYIAANYAHSNGYMLHEAEIIYSLQEGHLWKLLYMLSLYYVTIE